MLGHKQMLNMIRAIAFDAQPGTRLIDDDISSYIDAAIGYYQVKCANDAKDIFLKPIDISYVANQQMYRWCRFVSRVSHSERTDTTPHLPGNPITFEDSFALNYPAMLAYPQQDNYFLRNTELGIAPTPGSSTGTMRLWASSACPPMHYGTVSAAAATTLTFPSPPTRGNLINLDNAYSEVPILVTDSTERIMEPNIITSYVAATRVATMGFTWKTTPGVTSIYQLCPPMPEQFHPLIVMRGTMFAKIALEDVVTDLKAMEEDFKSTFLNYISKMQDQKPKMVRKYGWRG